MKKRKKIVLVIIIVILIFMLTSCAELGVEGGDEDQPSLLSQLLTERSNSVKIVVLLTILSVLPSILIMLTCFPRIIIVLSIVRNGMGMQQMPPNQVLVGLALFLTFFVMSPVVGEIKTEAYEPYISEEVTLEEAVDLGMVPVREFMLRQTYKKDLDLFISLSEADKDVETIEEVSNTALIPAFMTSEIKRGFQIGFFIYIPFVVIDMIVASTLMSMGMMMLPPIVISLPFKLLLFVLVDGWTLTVKTLITSFN